MSRVGIAYPAGDDYMKLWKIGTLTGNTNTNSDRPLCGLLYAVYIDYAVTPNANTDVVLATVNAPVNTILTVTNSATNGWYYPRAILHDSAAAAITYDGSNEIYGLIPIADHLKITTTGADSDQLTSVWVMVGE